MPQDRFSLNTRASLLAAIASAYPVIGYGAPAAQVDFAVGNVTAVNASGQSRQLGKGAQIEQGDTVNTNGGRAQLRFTDGAYVSLQPESQFRIDQYRFDGKQDGNEKGFFSLLKGGLRTITGLVGRTNKSAYQVTTSVATIGIRGTEYTIEYGHSITGSVGEGEINVCNPGGCLSVMNGESYYVQSPEVKPVLTSKRTDLPPPEPTQPPSNFVQGDQVNPGFVLTGTVNPANYAMVSDNFGCCASPFATSGSITLDGNGVVTDLNGAGLTDIKMAGNDGVIAWGTGFSSSGGETVHFVLGLPTSSTDMSNLQIAKTVATYDLLGGTAPTLRFSSLGSVTGTLTSASLTADFNAMTVNAAISTSFNVAGGAATTVSGSSVGMQVFSGSTFASFSASNTCTVSGGGSCSVNMAGFFAGANAMRAGLAYGMNVSIPINGSNEGGNVIGAAAFTRR